MFAAGIPAGTSIFLPSNEATALLPDDLDLPVGWAAARHAEAGRRPCCPGCDGGECALLLYGDWMACLSAPAGPPRCSSSWIPSSAPCPLSAPSSSGGCALSGRAAGLTARHGPCTSLQHRRPARAAPAVPAAAAASANAPALAAPGSLPAPWLPAAGVDDAIPYHQRRRPGAGGAGGADRPAHRAEGRVADGALGAGGAAAAGGGALHSQQRRAAQDTACVAAPSAAPPGSRPPLPCPACLLALPCRSLPATPPAPGSSLTPAGGGRAWLQGPPRRHWRRAARPCM